MVDIVTRAGKGSPLTNNEVDDNFTNLKTAIEAGGTGNVVGPASSVDNAIARFDATTGKLIQNSAATLSDAGRLSLTGAASVGMVSASPSTTQQNILEWRPSDFGAGKPLISFDKLSTSDAFQLGTWDGAGSPGTFQFAVAKVRFTGTIESGHILPTATSTYDVGSAAARVRNIYADTLSLTGGVFTNGVSGLGPGVQITAGAAPFLEMVRYNGPIAAPTTVKAFDTIMWLTGKGRKETAWSATSSAIQFEASQDWTDGSTPSHINFQTTPIGANAPVYRWHLSNAGHIWPFADQTYDFGIGSNRIRDVYARAVNLTGGISGTDGTFSNAVTSPAFSLSGNAGGTFFTGPGYSRITLDTVNPTYLTYATATKYLTYHVGATLVMQLAPNGDFSLLGGLTAPTGTFSSTVTGLTVQAKNGTTVGYIGLKPGGLNNSGYVEFYSAANVRVGYIGFADSTNNYINITAEAGYTFKFNDPVKFMGEITFGASSDLVEPRGKYYAITNPTGTNYDLTLADQGKLLYPSHATGGTPQTITIPLNSVVAFPVGARIDLVQWGTGAVSVVPSGAVVLVSVGNKRKLAAQYAGATLTKMGSPDIWLLVGDLIA